MPINGPGKMFLEERLDRWPVIGIGERVGGLGVDTDNRGLVSGRLAFRQGLLVAVGKVMAGGAFGVQRVLVGRFHRVSSPQSDETGHPTCKMDELEGGAF